MRYQAGASFLIMAIGILWEIKLSKKLIFGMVLSLLLVSGVFFSLKASSGPGSNGSLPPSDTCSLWDSTCASRDSDKDTMGKQVGPAASQGSSEHDTNKKHGSSNDSGRTSQ